MLNGQKSCPLKQYNYNSFLPQGQQNTATWGFQEKYLVQRLWVEESKKIWKVEKFGFYCEGNGKLQTGELWLLPNNLITAFKSSLEKLGR